MMHVGNLGGMGFGGFGLGWTFMIIFWALVILGVVYLIRYLPGNNRKEVCEETVEDILRKRFASGEITKDEFDEKIKILKVV